MIDALYAMVFGPAATPKGPDVNAAATPAPAAATAEIEELAACLLAHGFLEEDVSEGTAYDALSAGCASALAAAADEAVDATVRERRERKLREAAVRNKEYTQRREFRAGYTGNQAGGAWKGAYKGYRATKAIFESGGDDVPLASVVDIRATMVALEAFLARIQAVESDCGTLTGELPSLPDAVTADVVRVFDHMLTTFAAERFKRRYHYTMDDHRAAPLKEGGSVPLYYANVVAQSVHRRKVLSMAGLRNLVRHGPAIYADLRAQMFAGNPAAYPSGKGLHRMRELTGNTVDLDTCVLRPSCPVQLRAINAHNKHLGDTEHANAKDFAKSAQAQSIAREAATTLLDQFCKDFDLDEKAAEARGVRSSLITSPIPVASNNNDRGKHPVWHYVNCGVDSFHANVPNLFDVNGALLKSPFRCAEVYLRVHYMSEGDAQGLADRLDTFFEDAVADSCFNQKWRALEDYAAMLGKVGSIVDVLQTAQQANQAVFLAIMDEEDPGQEREKQALWGLVEGKIGRALHPDAGGAMRAIQREDVDAWVDDPAVVL